MWPFNSSKKCSRCFGLFAQLHGETCFCFGCNKHEKEFKAKFNNPEPKHSFKNGDIVELKSGGPTMTVYISSFDKPNEFVQGFYINEINGKFEGANFHHSLLGHYKRPQPRHR